MSKKVCSDGSVQRAFLQAISDPALSMKQLAGLFVYEKLNKVNKPALIKIKTIWHKRFNDSNPPTGRKDECVIGMLTKFINIREKQSPILKDKQLVDYSILFKDENKSKKSATNEELEQRIEKLEKTLQEK